MAENENKQENVVVEDFKRTNAKKSKKKFRHRQQNPVLAFYEDNKQDLSARCSNLAAWTGCAGTDHSWCDLRKTDFYGVMRTGLCSWNFIFKIYQRVENRRLLHSGNNFPAAVFF